MIGLGILLDALAYVWVRRSVSRGIGDLEIRATGSRMRLRKVPYHAAKRIVDLSRVVVLNQRAHCIVCPADARRLGRPAAGRGAGSGCSGRGVGFWNAPSSGAILPS